MLNVARRWGTHCASEASKLDQPNDGRSRNLRVNFLRFVVRPGKAAGTDIATPGTTATDERAVDGKNIATKSKQK